MKKILNIFLFIFSISPVFTQTITGVIVGIENNKEIPLVGANVYWLETFNGSTTNEKGEFTIQKEENDNKLIISFIGYEKDTVTVDSDSPLKITLKPTLELGLVTVEGKTQSTQLSLLDPINVQTLGANELAKAPCCNLSESFETNASIDASFSDAVTGTRQIKMLGLSGAYTQLMQENMPGIRGLYVHRGLGYIPGTWLQSIQISKGAGSVTNGFESITGQINLELKKPKGEERLLLNTYVNQGGRVELNALKAIDVNEKWSTSVLLHGSSRLLENDMNNDDFLDNPMDREFHLMNRWKFNGESGWEGQIGFKASKDDKTGGQEGFEEGNRLSLIDYNAITTPTSPVYGVNIDAHLINSWAKMGKVMKEKPGTSIGFQLSGTHYKEETFMGYKDYFGEQNSLYFNSIYQSIIGNTNHQYKIGFSTQIDDYKEEYGYFKESYSPFERTEIVPGAFFEYTFLGSERWNIIAGVRGDYHNLFGAYLTPRLHARYSIDDHTSIKLALGQGRRTANIIAENLGLMASNGSFYRVNEFEVNNLNFDISTIRDLSDLPYNGLNQEIAWNTGLNLTKEFHLDYREGSITFDFYHTRFEQEVVVDQYWTAGSTYFYNLDGESYTNSFQIELNYELVKRLDIRMAYRWVEAFTTYQIQGRQLKPFNAKNRAFVNLEYKTRKGLNWQQWKFDITAQWIGKQAIPSARAESQTSLFDPPFSYSDPYFLINTQITRVFNNKFNVYAGVENLNDYRQENAIFNATAPYEDSFDASKIWAPIFGRNIYIGLNYRINK